MRPIPRLLLASLIAALLIAASFTRPFDRSSEAHLDQALRNALVTFAVARTLNAAISVVQATELSFSPAGVGVTVAPGEALDPLNDLVERFSWVMLAAATSLGIQKLLLHITGDLAFSVAMSASLALLLLALWKPRWQGGRPLRAIFGVAAVLVALRFGMSAIGLANGLIYDHFLAADYQQAAEGLSLASERIETLGAAQRAEAAAQASDPGLMERMKGLWNDATETLNPVRQLEALKTAAAEAIDHVIRLIVVFVLQTILFPLVFLWALYRLVALLVRGPVERAG